MKHSLPSLFIAIGLLTQGCGETKKVEGFPDNYAGIGLELTVEKDVVRVIRPLKGGPSDTAGIIKDDRLLAINGQTTKGMSLGEVVHRLRGRPNSQLTLALQRKGERILVVLRRQKLRKTAKGDYEATK